MQFKIGFSSEPKEHTALASPVESRRQRGDPVKSLVQVRFPDRRMTLSYYNDAFDLHPGDTVYVDGKLEGLRGQVVSVSRSFKIRLSDYKRVIGLAETDVSGSFLSAGSHLISFDTADLPPAQVRTWFLPPEKDEDEYISGQDGVSFPLADISALKASPDVAERGRQYYADSRVSYLCLDGSRGYAIVEGSRPYEVEFTYAGGLISGLTCPCWCSSPCKHQVAVLLQLKETLGLIEERYAARYARSGCFAAVSREVFFTFAIGSREDVSITLE